jgi:hypothetical protein
MITITAVASTRRTSRMLNSCSRPGAQLARCDESGHVRRMSRVIGYALGHRPGRFCWLRQ